MAGPNITLINIYYYITTFLCYVYFLIHDVSDALSSKVFNLCAGCKSLQHLCKVGATRVNLSNGSRVNGKN